MWNKKIWELKENQRKWHYDINIKLWVLGGMKNGFMNIHQISARPWTSLMVNDKNAVTIKLVQGNGILSLTL